MPYKSFSDFLYQKYQSRKERNPRYSLRSFSRDLGISSGRLTNLLKERDIPGPETIERICLLLNLSNTECEMIKEITNNQKYLKRGAGFSRQLNQEEFSSVSDWKTWCIYTLFQSSEFIPNQKWFDSKLKLTPSEFEISFAKLLKLGLIEQHGDFYNLACESVTTTNDVPSSEIRKFHKEFIGFGVQSLEVVPVSLRDVSSLTMCVGTDQLPVLKKLISEFRSEFNQIAKKHNKTTELYQLNIQFFPMNIGDFESNEI